MEVIIGEVSKGYKNKNMIEKDKKIEKYAQMKRFHYELQLQVYMYTLMYIDTETMT